MWVLWVIMISCASWWDTALLYRYVRLEDEGRGWNFGCGGGEDHVVGINPSDYKEAYDVLESWAQAHWPAAAQEVVYRWTGQVLFFSSQLWRMQVWSFSQSISLRQFQSDSQKPTSLDWGLQSFSLPSNIRRNSESRNWGNDQKS